MNKNFRFLPSTKKQWKKYFFTFYPVILGAMLFSLNGFVDNFMVGRYNGVAAISAANQWTNIVTGIVVGVGAAGGIISAQLYHQKRYQGFKQMAAFRYVLTTSLILVVVIVALIMPDDLNALFLKQPSKISEKKVYDENLKMASDYLKITTLQWILLSISGNMGIQLREIGHGKIVMHWGVGTLIVNISLNAILIYGLDVGVKGAAWASVAARFLAIMVGIIYIIKKNLRLKIKLKEIFSFDSHIIGMFFKRFALFFAYSTMIILVTFRNYFYDKGYPQGSIGAGIGATAILGLSNAIMNVFTTIFAAVGTMSANFVGSELGKGNIKQAKINSDHLRGFNTLMAFLLSLALAFLAIFVPYMSFLVNTTDQNVNTTIQLLEVRNTLWVISIFYPLWIWFSTTYRNGVSGGKTFIFSFTDWILNFAQIGWAAFIMGPLRDSLPILHQRFWLAYIIFFASDFLKLIAQEINYYTINWAQVIKKEEVDSLKNVVCPCQAIE